MPTTVIQQKDVIEKARGTTPVPEIDYGYILWLGSIALAVMASACFFVLGILYFLDTYLLWKTGTRPYGPDVYQKLMVMICFLGGLTFLVRYADNRIKAYHAAITMYQLSERISAIPKDDAGGGIARFEISCTVNMGIHGDDLLSQMEKVEYGITNLMNQTFLEAISDPIVRFSKDRMEQMLKAAASAYLGESLKKVQISDIRQVRVATKSRFEEQQARKAAELAACKDELVY